MNMPMTLLGIEHLEGYKASLGSHSDRDGEIGEWPHPGGVTASRVGREAFSLGKKNGRTAHPRQGAEIHL